MALIGSTGDNVIQNLVVSESLEANAIDKSLAALVEQIGGTCWKDGDPYVYPGNLGYANLASSPRLSNLYKREPYIPTMLSLTIPSIPDSQRVMGVCSVPVVAQAFAFTYSNFVPGQTSSVTGTIRFFANGVEEGSIEVALAAPGAVYKTYVVGRRYEAGTVIGVDASSLVDENGSGVRDLVFTFWGKTEDTVG